jgi:alpha-1,3-rhamnosyl/mannosyltransferase
MAEIRVFLDVQPLVSTGGIATYTRALVDHLAERVELVYYFAALRGAESVRRALGKTLWMPSLADRVFERMFRKAGVRARSSLTGGRPASPTVFHGTNYLTPRSTIPTVVTLHDLSVFWHPAYHPAEVQRQASLLPEIVRDAQVVVVPSPATARDTEEFLAVPASKIRVIPLAPTPLPPALDRSYATRRFGIERPYVLSVGALEPRKNLPRLIQAFRACEAARDHALVLVGPHAWGAREVLEAASHDPRIRVIGPVHQEALATLCAHSACFAYPSLFEGFGLPPLDAMAAGIPVVAGNRGSLPDVLGDAALLVEPDDVTAISEAIGRVLQDESLAADLRARGLARSGLYSWEKTAELTYRAYEAALE